MPPRPWDPVAPYPFPEWEGVLPGELEFGLLDTLDDGFWVIFRPMIAPAWEGSMSEWWVRTHLPVELWEGPREGLRIYHDGIAAKYSIESFLMSRGFVRRYDLDGHTLSPQSQQVDIPLEEISRTLTTGGISFQALAELAQEVAGEGPYPMLAAFIRLLDPTLGESEIVTQVCRVISGADRAHIEAAVASAIETGPQLAGRGAEVELQGHLVDVTVYNRELTGEEVARIYQQGSTTEMVPQEMSEEQIEASYQAIFNPPVPFEQRVRRVLEGQGWLSMEIFYESLVANGWEPSPVREGLDAPYVQPRMAVLMARRLPSVEVRGQAPHVELRWVPVMQPMPTDYSQIELRVLAEVAKPPLAARVIALFDNNLSLALTFEDIENGLGSPDHTTLQDCLRALVEAGRLYFHWDQHSSGYRLVRREGAEPISAWERLKGDSDL